MLAAVFAEALNIYVLSIFRHCKTYGNHYSSLVAMNTICIVTVIIKNCTQVFLDYNVKEIFLKSRISPEKTAGPNKTR